MEVCKGLCGVRSAGIVSLLRKTANHITGSWSLQSTGRNPFKLFNKIYSLMNLEYLLSATWRFNMCYDDCFIMTRYTTDFIFQQEAIN
jgi:hypothetical protein